MHVFGGANPLLEASSPLLIETAVNAFEPIRKTAGALASSKSFAIQLISPNGRILTNYTGAKVSRFVA
jgi:hypothetical protein